MTTRHTVPKAASTPPTGAGARAWLARLTEHAVGWAATLLTLFLALKVAAVAWFLNHGVDPFSDYAAWKIPLLAATDLSAAVALAVVFGILAARRWQALSGRILVATLSWALALGTVAIAAVNLRIVEAYRAALDRYLLRKVGDPSVMSESIVANMDLSFVLALVFGLLLVVLLPRWLSRRITGWRPARVYAALAGLVVCGSVPLALAHGALSGRETFGLKHNALLALAVAPPEIFQYADPDEAYARLKRRLPQGAELRALAQTSVFGEAAAGHVELRGRGQDYNVVLLLLESVGAGYLDAQTMPNLSALAQRSVRYVNHRTTAVNTFDAHYALFRSTPVRGDAFVMRELHQGYSRDLSIMELLKRAGYSIGMFHASFLNFIDTRWVWEAPGVDKLVDAQDVISPARPGWSWGANDADVADVALKWAKSQGERRFFLVFNPAGSHHPYLAPRTATPFPGDDCQARYKSALFAVDQSIGRLLSGLREGGLERRTVVMVVSDHGELIDTRANVCGHGMDLVEQELKVPFFIHHPSLTQAGQTEQLQTDHWDFAPTLAALLGLDAPAEWLGRDLLAERVVRRPTFVGLNYRKHTAIVVAGAIGDLDVGNSRMTWRGKPPEHNAEGYEQLLRSFDDRVVLQHATRVLERRR